MDELSGLRQEYVGRGLSEQDLADDPVAMFDRWFHDAVEAGLHEPNAMVLATASREGLPSARMVLLKGYDARGFRFFTNYDSRKGAELAANPACALLFGWHVLGRQVRVEGRAERLGEAESAAYFATRPRLSQIGAWASPQSRTVDSRDRLDERYAAEQDRFATETDVPLPPYWGGFLVTPHTVEFWQGREGRMHDRLRYVSAGAGGWRVERLAP
ncbi:MAG TPA: pyridoxamine 5'-phosphate oxidase [Nocardioidaceae bacterium]|nr:pyridoxamine 5'-phosphate oxidase [Nocardioidaceae bacterium]